MIPIVLGIVLVTFALFNVAGGDPALIKLGKNASPEALEEYDLQRGYDKPLFMGMWGRTRAYRDTDFEVGPGGWNGVPGAFHTNRPSGRVVLGGPGKYIVPVFFRPSAGHYLWLLQYRVLCVDGTGSAGRAVWESNGERMELQSAGSWCRATLPFDLTGSETGELASITVERGSMELRSLTLRRRTRGILDSQLVFYLSRLSRLDFGVSQDTNERISRMLLSGVGPSLMLMVPIFIVELVLSIALALMCAFFRDTWLDRSFVVFSVVLMSVNYLVWMIVGQYLLGYRFGWFPVWGFESWHYLLLPVIVGVVSGLGGGLRFYRTVMLDEMYRDYVRTAFAKGAGRSRVLFVHVLKNAMIPILTNVIMTIPFLYTGSLLLERMFGIPGLGNMAYEGILNSDVDVIRAVVFVGAVIYVLASLVTDICYAMVDPRVRLE